MRVLTAPLEFPNGHVCTKCNLHRTAREFQDGIYLFENCSICRSKHPELKAVYVVMAQEGEHEFKKRSPAHPAREVVSSGRPRQNRVRS